MSMRSQVYEWTGSRTDTGGNALTATQAGKRISVFIGGYGNNITKPAETTATQFIVIEDIASTPYLGGAVQIRINTTDYFQNPDVTDQAGIPGLASPYPRGSATTVAGTAAGDNLLKSFDLYPDVYVLPGQVFDVLVTFFNSAAFAEMKCFTKYTLYDGPDALIANKLLEMGISINPGNVDWYKRTLIQSQSAPAPMA
jgi:hypothetical protein